jgi:hypothetical protein
MCGVWDEPREPELAELAIADDPEVWRATGFDVDEAGNLDLGGVRLRLGSEGESGIVSWSVRRVNAMGSVDGLPTPVPHVLRPPPFKTHPNGATSLDHLVVMTPDFDRTADALKRAGMPLKRTQDIGRVRQGFRRLGPAILELVHNPKLKQPEFWGLMIVVISLEDLTERLGEHLSEIRPAVQPGRRIATLRPSAGLSPAIAFMSPEPP